MYINDFNGDVGIFSSASASPCDFYGGKGGGDIGIISSASASPCDFDGGGDISIFSSASVHHVTLMVVKVKVMVMLTFPPQVFFAM